MTNVIGDSANPSVPAVVGKHSANGIGVSASSEQSIAIRAAAKKDTAVFATSDAGVGVDARSNANTAVLAKSNAGRGIDARSEQSIAIQATAKKDTAVLATSDAGVGVDARSNANTAVLAKSNAGRGIDARSEQSIAIQATAKKDTAVLATSDAGVGVDARSNANTAVAATSDAGIGVSAISKKNIGVYCKGGTYAGYFEGIVMVTGDIQLQNADCAEDFEVLATETVEAGTVMALNDIGQLEQGKQPYDKRVAGVVSGAGDLKPGLVLGRQPGHTDRVPLALMGRVHCKVDANYESIEVGDLLTTSATPGHAMKASDPARSFGAVIGKALRPLKTGTGMVPILVALQ